MTGSIGAGIGATKGKLNSEWPARSARMALIAAIILVGANQAHGAGLPEPEPEARSPYFDFDRFGDNDQDWSGFSLGASIGYGFGETAVSGGSGNFNIDNDGVFLSLYAGHDWQFGNFLISSDLRC